METIRFTASLAMLDDARHLLGVDRWASAISRAYYCSYQAMWAVLGTPPQANQWRHAAIIAHFVRGYWFAPEHPQSIQRQDRAFLSIYVAHFSGSTKSGSTSTTISGQ